VCWQRAPQFNSARLQNNARTFVWKVPVAVDSTPLSASPAEYWSRTNATGNQSLAVSLQQPPDEVTRFVNVKLMPARFHNCMQERLCHKSTSVMHFKGALKKSMKLFVVRWQKAHPLRNHACVRRARSPTESLELQVCLHDSVRGY
jgi:hypothetical protein